MIAVLHRVSVSHPIHTRCWLLYILVVLAADFDVVKLSNAASLANDAEAA
jgi:hypothetical protein